jgi:proteasome activator subunit 4
VTFVNFVGYARLYFDTKSTAEMLEEWRTLICPFDMSMSYAFERFDLFLPTLLKENEIEHGFKLWLDEFLNLWFTLSGKRIWESV